MSAAKQWDVVKADFPYCQQLGKPYNEYKYNALYAQFEKVNNHFEQDQRIIAHSRMTAEEVSNIIENNVSWNRMRVRTEYNQQKTIFKTDIIYDGTEYFNPEDKNITNVIGSKGFFKRYTRNYKIENGEVRISVHVEI
ncbi:MAG: hypothetical protein A2381_12310 [Bdellovibrionales bacterium RIFOXYB1_FULL_37_110]|nr:MAG: hypothetical protein A2181_02030 [Bdellovibrionales bacterium RIFOXYA1_FULL_38_20]OFZ52279.1 MAG: hypothetical protein A2417_06150 [Bdellovibrionales bacterium RIFOXYC1_FULL_37_79]OFZ57266.1 MAG: hypothetical protein A2381_12310 [Bdellovibrionales bacterium RIFOXYB1_FULL_37_110]HAB50994.1 hypothetical protein [Ignavibacteriales bacterium]